MTIQIINCNNKAITRHLHTHLRFPPTSLYNTKIMSF